MITKEIYLRACTAANEAVAKIVFEDDLKRTQQAVLRAQNLGGVCIPPIPPETHLNIQEAPGINPILFVAADLADARRSGVDDLIEKSMRPYYRVMIVSNQKITDIFGRKYSGVFVSEAVQLHQDFLGEGSLGELLHKRLDHRSKNVMRFHRAL